ncbi:hypothetical protein [Croceimicrobium hydrocarbonivorans]|uniref:Uncharacterized protein n=1 Tax=Croceimicrobium hydrocarbonivorans TaxID=2761580 RepID=A0A7H0VC58_9FLAO|nr:hypothetical protein [Croceimicrobium hydrocarbonivorans]QNR23306.1 hypothetical protein H4K34_13090 [Croceimicrobium hydrocarbonivorans]
MKRLLYCIFFILSATPIFAQIIVIENVGSYDRKQKYEFLVSNDSIDVKVIDGSYYANILASDFQNFAKRVEQLGIPKVSLANLSKASFHTWMITIITGTRYQEYILIGKEDTIHFVNEMREERISARLKSVLEELKD